MITRSLDEMVRSDDIELARLLESARTNFPRLAQTAEHDPEVMQRFVRLVAMEAMLICVERGMSDAIDREVQIYDDDDDVDIDALIYDEVTRAHAQAQADAKRLFPATVAHFFDILHAIKNDQVTWRPQGCDATGNLTREHIDYRDPDLHDATARIALATRLASMLATSGKTCGLELFDQAWEKANPQSRPDWGTLAARA